MCLIAKVRLGMDAAADDPENPARLINAAANEEQCKQVGIRKGTRSTNPVGHRLEALFVKSVQSLRCAAGTKLGFACHSVPSLWVISPLEVNTEICQLGNVLYFRTLQEVPAGTELVTDYGRLLT